MFKNVIVNYFVLPILVVSSGIYIYLFSMDIINEKGYGIPENILRVPKPKEIDGYEVINFKHLNGNVEPGSFYYLSNKRQVIFRFDKDRYLELQGEGCSGLIWYINNKDKIKTRIENVFFTKSRLPTFLYTNPGEEYIGIPVNDLSIITYSIDRGRNFTTGYIERSGFVTNKKAIRYVGIDAPDYTLNEPAMGKSYFFGSGNTSYIEMDDGDIVFGRSDDYYANPSRDLVSLLSRVQYFYSKNDLLTNKRRSTYSPPKTYVENIGMPDAKPHDGWDRIRCVVGNEK